MTDRKINNSVTKCKLIKLDPISFKFSYYEMIELRLRVKFFICVYIYMYIEQIFQFVYHVPKIPKIPR